MKIAEPDVSLTDFLLTVECLGLAWLMAGPATNTVLQAWFIVAFLSVGISALLGGISHGFLSRNETTLDKLVWRSTIALLGVTSLSMWILATEIIFGTAVSVYAGVVAGIALVGYVFVVVSRHPSFALALAYYLPAATYLLVAFSVAAYGSGNGTLLIGTGGMALSLIAAGVQQKQISLHRKYFNHNALYHLLQAIALGLIYWAAHELIRTPPVY